MSISFNDIVTYGGAKFKVVKFATSQDINNLQNQLSNLSTIPLGTILPYSANSVTPPAGFSFCDGTTISRSLYSDLFSLIGTKYGDGDGETTFNIPDLTDAAWLNGSYEKTAYETAGNYTFTATKPGWYKITVKGAGGGGGAGGIASLYYAGHGGGEGGTTIGFERMNAGDMATVIIGAGGTGSPNTSTLATNGGNSSVTINLNTYTGGGGNAGGAHSLSAGAGGIGTIVGAPGSSGDAVYNNPGTGGNGGGNGGGVGGSSTGGAAQSGTLGGGGGGGAAASGILTGGNGGDGYVWIEYIGTSQNFIIKTLDGASSNSALINLSQYMNALNNKADKADGVPIGTMIPFTGNGNLPAGYLLCDGSAVSRSMYEDLFVVIGTTYGDGDGVETFNLPDLGFVDGEEAKVYGEAGKAMVTKLGLHADALSGDLWTFFPNTYGVANTQSVYENSFNLADSSDGVDSNVYSDLTSAVSGNIRYIIKAFNGMNTHGALLDLTGMANELNKKYDARTDFTIIYPNGGTAENPANVASNSRYVMDNPFPSYAVFCEVEVLLDSQWGCPGFVNYNSGSNQLGQGVTAKQLNNNSIVVQSGNSGVVWHSNLIGSPHGTNTGGGQVSAPCRVKVWKIGKIN